MLREPHLSGLDDRMIALEGRMIALEARMDGLSTRLSVIASRLDLLIVGVSLGVLMNVVLFGVQAALWIKMDEINEQLAQIARSVR